MVRKRIVIPKDLKCKECGSTDLIGAGTDWKSNPDGDNPPRIKVQKYRCKTCGLIFVDGEVIK